jgi:hypothetical protein
MTKTAHLERLDRQIVEHLILSGPREHSFDAPNDGGFTTYLMEGSVAVNWHTSQALSLQAFERFEVQDISAPIVKRYGEILFVMARTMLEILRAGGLDARMSTSEYSSTTVEVHTPNP